MRKNQNSKWATHQQLDALRRVKPEPVKNAPVTTVKEEPNPQLPTTEEVATEVILEANAGIVEEVLSTEITSEEIKPLVKKGKNKE